MRKSRMRGQPRGWRFFLKKMRLVGQNAAFLKKSVFYLYPNCANKILVRLLYILRHTLKRVCRIRTNDRARVFYFSSETRLKTRSYFNPYVVSPGQVFFFLISRKGLLLIPPLKNPSSFHRVPIYTDLIMNLTCTTHRFPAAFDPPDPPPLSASPPCDCCARSLSDDFRQRRRHPVLRRCVPHRV